MMGWKIKVEHRQGLRDIEEEAKPREVGVI
jgi:hypothetical protein